MYRKLDLADLAWKIYKSRIKHRRAMERWLDDFVVQPQCGCKLRWEWIWAVGDWILPVDVAVASTARRHCKYHDPAYYDVEDFQETLLGLLSQVRVDTKNEIGPLDEGL